MIETAGTCAMAADRGAVFAEAARGKISAQANDHKSRRKWEKASRRPPHAEHIRPHDSSVGTEQIQTKGRLPPCSLVLMAHVAFY
jgi:hypothetical protein